MIQEYARVARPYFVLLSIVAIGRFLMGTAFGVPYEKGTHVLSIVTLTLFASLFTAAFTRRWLGYRLVQAAGLTMFMAFVSQLVILALTAWVAIEKLAPFGTQSARLSGALLAGLGIWMLAG